MSKKRFRIAFSFAGENRDFVSKVAAILASKFGEEKILYDKYHEAEFARYDLGIYLPKLYRDESDLIVAVLCKDYDQKQWTGWEWMAIYAQLTKGEGSKIMLTRFDLAHVDGLFDAAAFVELHNKTPQQTAKLILERLAINEEKAPNHYIGKRRKSRRLKTIVTVGTSIHNNLPRLQYFFGRENELKKITGALSSDARGWGALIDGPGGIGKTSLAIRAAELSPPERFQRIIFLSSKERELTADGQRSLGTFVLPSYLEMLNAIAREMDQSELAKSTEAERAEVLLRALRGTEVLLVLDNLETLSEPDRDQLFSFLNRLPHGCNAIVTSRRRADVSALTVRLDRLDRNAAGELIAELSRENSRLQKSTEAERQSLYEETGGNPLLIRWITGQLGLGRCRTIASAVDLLRSAPDGNNPLEFIFGDLLDTFTDNEMQVLAALTYFTIPMRTTVLAELSGISEQAAQTALVDLATRALVVSDSEERNFTLVPLVADFLRKMRPEVVGETGRSLEAQAYALIIENGYEQYDRFPILDKSWPKLTSALPLFIVGPNERLQSVCDGLAKFLHFTGRYDESLSLSQQAEARAAALGDYTNVGWRAYNSGWIHYLRGQPGQLLACAKRASAAFKKAKAGPGELSLALELSGHAQKMQGDYSAAIASYSQELELRLKVSFDSIDVTIARNWLASAHHLSGNFDEAERNYDEALRLARKGHYKEEVAYVTGNLALLAMDRKQWGLARAQARKALRLSEKLGRQELIAENSRLLAAALVRLRNRKEALPYAQRAVEIYSRLNMPYEVEMANDTLAECGNLHNPDDAE